MKTKGFTVVLMSRGCDVEYFVALVEGKLTKKQMTAWRKTHKCDKYFDGDEDDTNNMFFRYVSKPVPNSKTANMLNADGETYR